MGGHTPLQNTEAKHFFWVSSKGAPYCHPRSIYVLMIFCGLTGLTMMVHFDMLVNHTSPNGISSKMDMRKSNVFGRTVPGIALVKWRCWCQHAQKCQIPPWKLIQWLVETVGFWPESKDFTWFRHGNPIFSFKPCSHPRRNSTSFGLRRLPAASRLPCLPSWGSLPQLMAVSLGKSCMNGGLPAPSKKVSRTTRHQHPSMTFFRNRFGSIHNALEHTPGWIVLWSKHTILWGKQVWPMRQRTSSCWLIRTRVTL